MFTPAPLREIPEDLQGTFYWTLKSPQGTFYVEQGAFYVGLNDVPGTFYLVERTLYRRTEDYQRLSLFRYRFSGRPQYLLSGSGALSAPRTFTKLSFN